MKYLFLMLLCFSAFSKDIRVDIVRDDGFNGSLKMKESEYPKEIGRLIKHPMYKGEWKIEQSGYILSREVETGWSNESGEAQPIMETQYYIPSNFSITITDITADLAVEEQARVDRLADIEAVKAIDIDTIQGASPEVKKILKRLIKELKE
jgi:hypothetical protein